VEKYQEENKLEMQAALNEIIRIILVEEKLKPDEAMIEKIRLQVQMQKFFNEIIEAGRRMHIAPAEVEAVVPESASMSNEFAVAIELLSSETPDFEGETFSPEPAELCDGSEPNELAEALQTAPAEVVTQAQKNDLSDVISAGKTKMEPTQKYRLLIPNATANVPYSHDIDQSKGPLTKFKIVAIEGLDAIGLKFEPATAQVHGTPVAEPGQSVQHELIVVLEPTDDSEVHAEACLSLFINPHPRTLWKQIEPDESLEHRKEHRCSLWEAGHPRILAASVRGRSHENSGAFREDDFHFGHDAEKKWTVVAVSDGAGSAPLSRLGSKLATETSVFSLLEALEEAADEIEIAIADATEDPKERTSKLLAAGKSLLLGPVGQAAFKASKAIQNKATELEVEEKALAATLMFAAVRRIGDEILVASYWIGDGGAALLDPTTGHLDLLGEADSGEYSGQTRFLLSSEFPQETPWAAIQKRFRIHCVPASAVLLLMTDGVSDPKFGTDNALRDPARWQSFWEHELAEQFSVEAPSEELALKLEEYLQFWSQGEHDDRTMALVYWP